MHIFLHWLSEEKGLLINHGTPPTSTQQQMSCNRIGSLRICSDLGEPKPNDCQHVSSDSRGCGADTLSITDCSTLHPGARNWEAPTWNSTTSVTETQ